MQSKKCCFIGHRNTRATPELEKKLNATLKRLIESEGVKVFLFGSKSRFDELCLLAVTRFKERYPEIKRVYVRAEYCEITKENEDYLLQSYDETYMPKRIENAGAARYVERNQEMINESEFVVVYYNESYSPPRKGKHGQITQAKSGTKLACEYATRKNKKTIINVFEEKTDG